VSTFYVLSCSLQFYRYGDTDNKTNRNITKQVYGKFRGELCIANKIRKERRSTYRLKNPRDTSLKLNLHLKILTSHIPSRRERGTLIPATHETMKPTRYIFIRRLLKSGHVSASQLRYKRRSLPSLSYLK